MPNFNDIVSQPVQPAPAKPPAGVKSFDQIMSNPAMGANQASMALGHSTGIIGKTLSAGWGALSDVAHGVQKGVESTEVGLGTLATKAVGAQGATEALQGFKQNNLQPQNLGETIGKTGEQIGEFFVPGGAEKGLAAKGAGLVDKVGTVGKAAKAVKAGIKGVTSALSFGGVTAAQTGDLNKAENAAEFGGALGTAGGIIEHFGEPIAKALQKADFRMTPMQEAKAGKVAEQAANFMSSNKITGFPETKFAKLNKITSDFESSLQKSLPDGFAISKADIAKNMDTDLLTLRETDPSVYSQAQAKVANAKDVLNATEGDTISLKTALQGKRSWGSDAFKTRAASKTDPRVSHEGSYIAEQAYHNALIDAMEKNDIPVKLPPAVQKYFGGQAEVKLPEFNKVYSAAINAKQLTGIARYRNDAGLFGRLFGLWAGKSIGQAVVPGLMGEIVGGGIGEVAAQKATGFARNTVERGLTYPGLPETVGKVDQPIENQ